MSSFPETQSHVFFDETIFFISSLSVIGHAQIDNFTISPVAEVCCAFSNFIIKILFTSIYINNHSPHHSWSPHHLTSHFSKVFHHKVKLFRHWHLRRSGKRCFSRKTNTCSDINVRLKSPSGEKSTFTHKFICEATNKHQSGHESTPIYLCGLLCFCLCTFAHSLWPGWAEGMPTWSLHCWAKGCVAYLLSSLFSFGLFILKI